MNKNMKYYVLSGGILAAVLALQLMNWTTFFLTILLMFFIPRFLIYACTDTDLFLFTAEKFGKKIDSLRGKVVWITGASSGIGEELAVCLASHGVKVVLSARREEELQRVRKRCLGANCLNENILVLPMDVRETDRHQYFLDTVLERFGQLDILVNNAGRSQRAIWENIDLEVDHQMFQLNVFSVVALSRIAVKYFQKRGEGHVAVMSSMAGRAGVPFSGTYTGAKHAIHGYFECLRIEKAGQGIHVTLLCPGPVETNFLGNCFTEKPDETYNKSMASSPFRLTAKRCGYLCAVALANRLGEAWMSKAPLLLLLCFFTLFPNVMNFLIGFAGPKIFLRMRDNRTEISEESKGK